jgi:hypothetical protein
MSTVIYIFQTIIADALFFGGLLLWAELRERQNRRIHPPRAAAQPADPTEKELGQRIDNALDSYAILIQVEDENTLMLEIARDRVETIRRELEELRQRNFEKEVSK